MRRFFENNYPPGYGYKAELTAVAIILGICFLGSLFGFCGEYFSQRETLFIRRGMDYILDESRIMPDFIHVLGDNLQGFLIYAALILATAPIMHYAYHYSGSKSICLMQRLPNSFELHRRCLLVPLLTALVFALVAFSCLLVYYAVYMNSTPKVCLMPDQWQKIWSVFK